MKAEEFRLNRGETKTFRTINEQIELLQNRGLIISDVANAKKILERTSYYRLSGYSLTLRKDDLFKPEITFDHLYEVYRADDAFRKIIFSYSTAIEVSFRSYISYYHAEKYGPLGYMDACNFDNGEFHARFYENLEKEIARSDDAFVHHHRTDLNCVFPFWVAIECSSFGELSKLYKNLKPEDRMRISKDKYGLPRKYVENWLQVVSAARNVAAHCGRFYNRRFKSVPMRIPPKQKTLFSGDCAFAIVYALYRLLPTDALRQAFCNELKALHDKYKTIDISSYGFPENWVKVLENS